MAEEIPLYNPEYLCQQLTRIATESFPSRREQPQNMQQCMEKYIADHLSEPLTLDTVAEAFSITPVYLSSWFKKNLGVSISDYIREKKIEKATHLLRYSDKSVIEIANYLAFSSQSHFIQTFESFTGLTPKKYRDKYYKAMW